MSDRSLRSDLAAVLTTADPLVKAERMTAVAARFAAQPTPLGEHTGEPTLAPWPDPAMRPRPPLQDPSAMPKRGLGSVAGRIALLHAVAHIELNAIDLAVDMAGRFGPTLNAADRDEFVADWLGVAADEARHFSMIVQRLRALGADYGDLPAHSGLWDAARRTASDVLARLAIAPMVLEARGLDVTPGMAARFRRNGDDASADLLDIIYAEEIGHVSTGIKWFRRLAQGRGLVPDDAFAALVGQHFPGGLKAPFNHDGRAASDFPRDWYEGLADSA